MNINSPAAIPPEPVRSRLMLRTWGGILWLLVLVALIVMVTTNSRPELAKGPGGSVPTKFESFPAADPVTLVSRDVADFSLTERSGETVTKQDLVGKPWVVNFIFTSCVMSCPANTTAMMNLAKQTENADYRLVTITVDPERDTPERLLSYAEIYGADPEKWLFLTGDKQDIHQLILTSFLQVVEEKQGENRLLGYEFAHSDRVMHINEQGTIIGQYLATDPREMTILRRVINGEMETPPDHQFLVAIPQTTGAREDDAVQVGDVRPAEIEPTQSSESASAAQPAEDFGPAGTEQTAAFAPDGRAERVVPSWLLQLPTVNAGLNSLATLLLLAGFVMIRRKNVAAHKACMGGAFLVSVVFLGFYLTYHFGLHYYTGESQKSFPQLGFIRQVYLTILISHILLAVTVPVLALTTLYHAWRQSWVRHRKWARITFPIWLYVSVTGVIIYGMLYSTIA